MISIRTTLTLATAALCCGAPVCADAQEAMTLDEAKARISALEDQVINLQRSLVESRKNEKESAGTLASIRTRLEALGHNLFDAGDDRLVRAAADIEVLTDRVHALETASTSLVAAVRDYLRHAVAADPDARMRVETAIRELDAAVGLRQKPRPDIRTGSLHGAQIVSIDSRSGMIVFNVGQTAGAKIGMSFRLVRGERPYGKAIVADVRNDVCGAFIEDLDTPDDEPRVGDRAILETTR
jgi:hypothetical protein